MAITWCNNTKDKWNFGCMFAKQGCKLNKNSNRKYNQGELAEPLHIGKRS